MIVVLVIVYAVFFAWACGWLAERKGLTVPTWQILGFLFGVFALIAVGFAPASGRTEAYTVCPRCGLHLPEEFPSGHSC